MPRVTLPTTRFTFGELRRLIDADAFGTERVELLNGRLHFKMTQREPHMTAITKGARLFLRVCGEGEWVVVQGTLRIDNYNAPDPDLMWLAVPEATPAYRWGPPILVVEVSDTTYRKDSGIKHRTYAKAGVPEYWIVNLKAGRVEVYRGPLDPTGLLADCRYESATHFARGQSISPLARPDVSLAVADLLP